MSYSDITSHIEEMYDTKISLNTLRQITDRIILEIRAWQSRPLEKMYPIVWLDAMHYKIKEDNHIKNKALYNILAITSTGKKEILGLYIAESEGAKFWLQILTNLHNRGLKDILMACTDNLKGFSEAISSIYPQTEIQNCIVHQIRNSLKYVTAKDKKVFIKDLKVVYQAPIKESAEEALTQLAQK